MKNVSLKFGIEKLGTGVLPNILGRMGNKILLDTLF
jgi:hypothetical protein